MLFSELLSHTPYLTYNKIDVPVTHLTIDSRTARDGSLFFCIPGVKLNRRDFAPDAYRAGCRAFIAEEPLAIPSDAAVATVPSARLSLADIAAAFYGNPAQALTLIGVTGTKGKTTTAAYLTALLSAAGCRCGYIGSLGATANGSSVATANTTPESLELLRLLSEMREAGVTHVVLEISSQSLSVGRVRGLRFPLVVLTGLGYDHVGAGEHESLSEYIAAKRELLLYYRAATVVYPKNAPHVSSLLSGIGATHFPVGFDTRSAVSAVTPDGQESDGDFLLRYGDDCYPVSLAARGRFNVTNAILASGAYRVLSDAGNAPPLPIALLANTLSETRIPGHMAVYAAKGDRRFVIDYAHNGQSMAALLTRLRGLSPTRLTVLFGAIGEHSRARRAELGRVAAQYADRAILTAEDPGKESPEAIAAEIRAAMGRADAVVIPDREEAVFTAVREAREGETVALCGKGATAGQRIGNRTLPYSEEETLLRALDTYGLRIP